MHQKGRDGSTMLHPKKNPRSADSHLFFGTPVLHFAPFRYSPLINYQVKVRIVSDRGYMRPAMPWFGHSSASFVAAIALSMRAEKVEPTVP
jgi:hypothetical protein